MEEGETKRIKVSTGDWERPHRPRITLPSEWVQQYTVKGQREVEITWEREMLIIRGVREQGGHGKDSNSQ